MHCVPIWCSNAIACKTNAISSPGKSRRFGPSSTTTRPRCEWNVSVRRRIFVPPRTAPIKKSTVLDKRLSNGSSGTRPLNV